MCLDQQRELWSCSQTEPADDTACTTILHNLPVSLTCLDDSSNAARGRIAGADRAGRMDACNLNKVITDDSQPFVKIRTANSKRRATDHLRAVVNKCIHLHIQQLLKMRSCSLVVSNHHGLTEQGVTPPATTTRQHTIPPSWSLQS